MEWILCKNSLPNEDELSYTTMVGAESGERRYSDKVLAVDSKGSVLVGVFSLSMFTHLYNGNCKTNKYTALHSTQGLAGWEFHTPYKIYKDIVAWMPLPEVSEEVFNE